MAQHSTATGQSSQSIKQRMLLKSDRIFQGCYLPEGRHDSGVKRLHSAAGQATASKPSKGSASQTATQVETPYLMPRCFLWAKLHALIPKATVPAVMSTWPLCWAE